MLTAIILIQIRPDAVEKVAESATEIEGVSEVYSVTGDWDLAVIIRVKESDRLSEVVTKQLCKIDGIVRTHTMVAFRAYGKADLDYLFA